MKLRKYLRENKIPYRIFAQELGISEQSLKNLAICSRRPGLLLALKIEKLTNGHITPSHLVEDYEKVSQERAAKH